jgi:hypothetical protein
MGQNALNVESRHVFHAKNQDKVIRKTESSQRIIFPAIVRAVDDSAGYNRIKAEIVNLDDKSQVFSGADWASSQDQLPAAIPLLPEYMHVRPQIGEMVILICTNPNDLTAGRYWIGPIITQQTKLSNQSFEQSFLGMQNKGSYKGNQIGSNPSTKNDSDAERLFAKQNEVAFQGRGTGDLVIGEKFVRLRTGIFAPGGFKENVEYPCNIELKIVDQPPSSTGVRVADSQMNRDFTNYSQQNITATNINLISPSGKDRPSSAISFEMSYNQRLKDFGDQAKSLHPAVLGDCLVDLLCAMVKYLTTHQHPPQSPPIPPTIGVGSDNTNLLSFGQKTVTSRYILSNVVRLN